MSDALPDAVETIFRTSLHQVNAARLVDANIRVAGDSLMIGERRVSARHGVYVIGLGKAAQGMVAASETAVGGLLEDGIAVTKAADPNLRTRSRVIASGHPIPDQRSLDAGAAILEFARRIPRRAVVLCLISGGGSALVEALRSGVTIDELRDVTDQLLRAGASIRELNAVRSRLSEIKAGGLLAALQGTTVVNLIVSDVLGDDLAAIASGPTVEAAGTDDADAVLRRYAVSATLPERRDATVLEPPYTLIIGNLALALREASNAAAAHGFDPLVLTQSLDGEAREVARTFASMLVDVQQGTTGLPSSHACLLAGGETVVTVRGDGDGGRNLEAALAAALRIEGVPNIAIGFLATDGDDGQSGAAGAIVSGTTIDDGNRSLARERLTRNDSLGFFRDRAEIVRTGPTGTNVNDLVIGVIGQSLR